MINLYGGLVLYAIATAFAIWSVRTGDRRALLTARFGALFGALDHVAYLIRLGVQTGHFPVTGAIEAYLTARKEGLKLSSAFPRPSAAELADVERIRAKLQNRKGYVPPSTAPSGSSPRAD